MELLPIHPVESHIRETITRHGMAREGERILAAVSGGADSIALLHILPLLGHAVEVAHFDHQTRQGASAEDAQFVRGVAEGLGIPFHLESRPITQEAAALGLSFEMRAREARYAFFAKIARERHCAVIATGHHQGDQAETVLMRLLRGAGPSGIGGIPPVRDLDGLRVIRPLIETAKADLERWLRERGLSWCEDVSNAGRDFMRNRVRHELLPSLRRDFNPRIEEALCRLAEGQRVESDFVHAQVLAVFDSVVIDGGERVDRQQFAGLHEALRRRCVLEWGWRHGVECPHERVADAVRFVLEGPVGHRFAFGNGIELYNGRAYTELVPAEAVSESKEPVRLAVPGSTVAFGRRFETSFLDRLPEVPLKAYAGPHRQVFDADVVGGEVWVRPRRTGDRFRPLGMNGGKSIKDYFIETGVPEPHRAAHPLAEAGGRIIWVVGHAVSAETAVTEATRRFLQIEVFPCD